MKKYFLGGLWLLLILFLEISPGALADPAKKVNLDFKDTDIRTVLKAFSLQAGLNVVMDEQVGGKVSVNITNMEPTAALELLLDAYGYNYFFKDEAIVVSSSKIGENLELRSFSLRYARAKDISELLDGIIDARSGEAMATSPKLNAISVTASPVKMRRISKIIRGADVAPAQVLIEAKIIELKSGSGDTTKSSVLGVNWKAASETHPTTDYAQLLTTTAFTTDATSLGFFGQMALVNGSVNAYLSALDKAIGYDLIAQPSVTTLNHEEASILIGSKYGYKTSIVSQTSTVETVNFLEVGTSLKLTPHINDQGFIVMDIYPSVSEGSVIDTLPQENTTETKSRVLVKDGQSIIIGGLTKSFNNQVEYGIPILMHIPVLGALFRRTELKAEKRDIMIIITPKIITAKILEDMAKQSRTMEKEQQKESGAHQLIHF